MEKKFSKSEVEAMLNKALLDGKIKTINYCLGYIDFLLKPIQEQLEYIEENGWTFSEDFFRLDERRLTLFDIKRQLEKLLIDLEIKKHVEKRTEP
jgi:hypothetical protein